MSLINRQFLLAARPGNEIKESDLRFHEAQVPELASGQVLVKTQYISVDPSMKGQMGAAVSYAPAMEIGALMNARGVGLVADSKRADLPVGSQVFGYFGMQDYAVRSGNEPHFHHYHEPVDPQAALSVLGGTGMTAYFGLLHVGLPKDGDTMLVSGAAGATGSVVGQIGKIKGCRVVGTAGTDEKCRWLTEDLGFDVAINYHSEDLADALDEHCRDGIDVFFDNVGGEILDLALDRINLHARLVICGGISRYTQSGDLPGAKNYFNLVLRRSRMEGFLLSDYLPHFEEARADLRRWYDSGRLKQRATVIEGFKQLPFALVQLFHGVNIGKMMVKVS